MKCIKCNVEFYSLDDSKRNKCHSCIKGFKEKSKIKIIREEERKNE